MTTNRKLAAILAADVVGYSRLMEADEATTLIALKDRRLEPLVSKHHDRIVKLMGVLIEFGSGVVPHACPGTAGTTRQARWHMGSVRSCTRMVDSALLVILLASREPLRFSVWVTPSVDA